MLRTMMMTRTRLLWEYPLYCIITAFYIPILSGAVLVFTGLRIRATLRRRRCVQIRLHENVVPNVANDQQSAAVRTVSFHGVLSTIERRCSRQAAFFHA